jgi:large subunit ribosomal protein L3
MPGLLAQKVGMTQIFTQDGVWVPVTVLKAGPCVVVDTRLKEKHGYTAVQLGFRDAPAKKKANKAFSGHFKSKSLEPMASLKELKTEKPDAYTRGDKITADLFQAGDQVDVIGTSKGKGFQGVIKRHHFAGMHATHGCSVSHRAPGSIGQRTYPGKVFKGKKMPGRMGGERVTMRNLVVVGIEAEQNLVLIRGSIPGANQGLVVLRPCTNDFETRFVAKKKGSGEAEAAPQQ